MNKKVGKILFWGVAVALVVAFIVIMVSGVEKGAAAKKWEKNKVVGFGEDGTIWSVSLKQRKILD